MILSLALVQTVIQYVLFYIGLSHAPGFKGSITSPTSTFFALLFAALLFRQEKLSARKLLGCLIGFAGVVLVSLGGTIDGGFRFIGEGFLILAAASYGLSSVLIKRFSAREDPVVLSGWQFVLGGALMTLAALCGGGRLRAVESGAWPLMLYLGSLSAVAYTLWSLLLGEGKVLDLPRCLLAILLVCLGVWIVNRPGKQAE